MSIKRCFKHSVAPSLSLVGRAMLVGSVLSFATACARRDAAKTDSTVASADSATPAAAATVTPASAVESISTGETTLPADSLKGTPRAAAGVAAPATKPVSTTAAATAAPATPKPVHHAATHTAAAMTAAPASSTAPAAAPAAAPATTAAAADTGQKTGADTSKKTAAAGTDKLLVDSATYEGWKIFASNCFRCHGEDAMGGTFAPNLRHSLGPEGGITHDLFLQTVTNGRPAKGMPAWGGTYTKEQFEQIYKYLMARSTGTLAPGRPHRASDLKPRSGS
jgi:mono/diheme cytochrome c family protein